MHWGKVKARPRQREGEAKPEEGERLSEVSQKQLTEKDLKELILPTAEETPTVPKQNLSAEDMQLMGLSPDSEVWCLYANFHGQYE